MRNSRSKVRDDRSLRSQHAAHRLCQQLNVSMSGYLTHSNGRPDSERKQQDQRLLVYIRAAHTRGRGTYGPLKIQTELATQGLFVGLNRIKRLYGNHKYVSSMSDKNNVYKNLPKSFGVIVNKSDQRYINRFES